MKGLPVVLDIENQHCVVIGIGEAGRRKAFALLNAGADVTTIDPVAEPIEGIRHLARVWQPGDCAGARVAVIATDDREVNSRAGSEAAAEGALVLRADQPSEGDLRFPAVFRAGPMTVAIDSGGASPALSVMVRNTIKRELGDDHENWDALAEWATANRDVSANDLEDRLEMIRGEW